MVRVIEIIPPRKQIYIFPQKTLVVRYQYTKTAKS